MQNDLSGIVELLRQINNRTSFPMYNDPFIDGIHRNFPDLLYNNSRFTSVQSVMEYINHQMHLNYNTYNRHFNDYWAARPPTQPIENARSNLFEERAAVPPPPPPPPSGVGAAPAAAAQQSLGASDIFAQIHNEMLEGARILGTLSNITTQTNTPADSPVLNGHRGTYMDDEIFLNGFGVTPSALPVTPPRPLRSAPVNAPPRRRAVGARELFRNLIPDFINFPEPALFMATTRTYRVHPINGLREDEGPVGLTPAQINSFTHTEERGEGQCPICYDDYSGNDLRVINVCNHAFHAECIEPWLQANNTCPMCRADVTGVAVMVAAPAPAPAPAAPPQ